MGAKSPRPDLDYTKVNGIKVEARNPAKLPLFGAALKIATEAGVDTLHEMDDVDEVLLANGTVVYQCVVPHNGCGATYETARKAMSHISSHRGRGAARRYEEQLKALTTENTTLKRRVSALTAAATRRANVQAAVGKPQPNGAPATGAETTKAIQEVERQAANASRAIGSGLEALQSSLRAALVIATQAAGPDPAVVEKAKKYDQLRELFPGQ